MSTPYPAPGAAIRGYPGWSTEYIRPVRLLLVEDNLALTERLRAAIDADPRVALHAAVTRVRDAMREIKDGDFDIAIVDIGLPDGSGLEIIRRIADLAEGPEAVVFTVFGEERVVLQALEAGATGYLIKGNIGKEVIDAILEVRAGGSPISPVIARQLLRRLRPQPAGIPAAQIDVVSLLTERERGILHLVTQGYTVQEIASKLFLSPHTVSSHVKKVYKKLHVTTRGQAIHEAYVRGLV